MSRSHRAVLPRSVGPAARRVGRTRDRARWPARRARAGVRLWRPGQSRPEVAWIRSARSRSCAISIQQAPFSGTRCRSPASVARDEVLEQDRTELDDAQCSLAPSDDGVDTRTVSVVWTDSAVAIAIKRHGIAAVAAFALARNQVNKRFGKCRRLRLGIHGRPDSSSGPGPPSTPGTCLHKFTGGGTASGAGVTEYASGFRRRQGGKCGI